MQEDKANLEQPVVKTLKSFNKSGVPIQVLTASLQDKLAGRITQEELTITCYDWSYHYALKDLEYRDLPEVPLALTEFMFFPEGKKAKLLKNDTPYSAKIREHLVKYRTHWSSVDNGNRVNKGWLLAMKKYYLSKEDWIKVNKVKETLHEHEVERA